MGLAQVTISLKKISQVDKKGWFAEWFDTEYYHTLYQNRDEEEAAQFIQNLCKHLSLGNGAKVADIACGKGRHSRVLAGMGCQVTGYDLSNNSINYAKLHALGSELFEVHDIRNPYKSANFNAAVNLFTSFGYFETQQEDLDSLQNIFNMLLPGGYFVQDYINGLPITEGLPASSVQECNKLRFEIQKQWEPPYIIKKIRVVQQQENQDFMEKVKVYSCEELQDLHTSVGFHVKSVFGNYQLSDFNALQSPRIIIISQKPL